jgi:hypothetical protein
MVSKAEEYPRTYDHVAARVRHIVQDLEDDDINASLSGDSSDFGDDSLQEVVRDLQTDIVCLMAAVVQIPRHRIAFST